MGNYEVGAMLVGHYERPVAIVFDSDLKDNPEIEWARWHLAAALATHGSHTSERLTT